MSKGPVVTGIGNALAVARDRVAARDAGKRWRCACGALASGPSCVRGHVAPWAVDAAVAAKQRRAAVLRAWRVRVGITMSPEQRAAWEERNRRKRVASDRARRERNRLAGTNGYRNRDGYLAYQARYNAARAEQKRLAERERYHRRKAA